MNTQTPAQALGEVLRLSESATPGKWAWNNDDQMWNDDDAIIIETDSGYYPPRKYDRALIAAAVNLIRQHGQHFAGLEEKLDVAMLAVKALQQDLHDQRWQHAQELKRAEAAEARVREAEWLLRGALTALRDGATDARMANMPARGTSLDQMAGRIAAFLAARDKGSGLAIRSVRSADMGKFTMDELRGVSANNLHAIVANALPDDGEWRMLAAYVRKSNGEFQVDELMVRTTSR